MWSAAFCRGSATLSANDIPIGVIIELFGTKFENIFYSSYRNLLCSLVLDSSKKQNQTSPIAIDIHRINAATSRRKKTILWTFLQIIVQKYNFIGIR